MAVAFSRPVNVRSFSLPYKFVCTKEFQCGFLDLCPRQSPEQTHPGPPCLTLPHPKGTVSMTAVLFARSTVALLQLLGIPNHFGVGLFVTVQFAGCQQAPARSPYRVRRTPAS